jgi:hypothetical protein
MKTLLFAALALLAPAFAQERGIRAVPGTGQITEPGRYLLNGNLPGGFGAAINISANDVSLDLNGQTLTGLGGNRGVGIQITGVSGVRVTNGTIANFAFGVVVDSSRSVHLEGLQIRGQGLAVSAPPPEVAIMIVQSRAVVVVNNSIYNTGLGIFVRGGQSGGNRIANNTVTAGTNGALGICYNPTPTDTQGPRGDLITGNLITGFGTGIQFSTNSIANVARDNTIAFVNLGIDSRNPTNVDAGNQAVKLP